MIRHHFEYVHLRQTCNNYFASVLKPTNNIFIARKRYLRRLCFHRCLCVHKVSASGPGGVSATHPLDRVHAGIPPLPSACWDTHPPAQCMLGPPCPVHAGIHTPCPVHAGIRSTSGWYAYHGNAFLFKFVITWMLRNF